MPISVFRNSLAEFVLPRRLNEVLELAFVHKLL